MGDKWSKMVKDQAFGTYGSNDDSTIAELMYNDLDESERFYLVRDKLEENETLKSELSSAGVNWPDSELEVPAFFAGLTPKQARSVVQAFEFIAGSTA